MSSETQSRNGAGGLEIELLRKTYGEMVAVRDISLSVKKGEFVTLLGQSGSGKTTTLMMVAGFVEPDSGSISLDGRTLVGVPTHQRSIGVVFQSYALFPHLTVADNVAFPLRMRDRPREEIARQVERVLDLVQLGKLHARKPSELSGGQQQRVALARALVFEPPILLLDEPLGALDRLLREEMKLELRRVHRELGTTMIYVTHDQDEALVLSDRIAVMKDGEIEQIGTPDDVYRRPDNSFVARFVGEGNFIRGPIVSTHGTAASVEIEGRKLQGMLKSSGGQDKDATLFVRPENVKMGGASDSGSYLIGEVEDILYEGELIRYHIKVGQTRISSKQIGRAESFRPTMGESVSLSWSPEDAIIFQGKTSNT